MGYLFNTLVSRRFAGGQVLMAPYDRQGEPVLPRAHHGGQKTTPSSAAVAANTLRNPWGFNKMR